MSDVPQIVDLASLLTAHNKDLQLVSYTSRYLTKIGDNYGSVMLALNLRIRRGASNEIEELPMVAKLPPITNPIYWEMFNPERTCVTENAMYKYLTPVLQSLQREGGVAEENLFDGLPKYFGSRISLDPNAKHVDRDAVLLLENLQTSGYRAGNRLSMYDLTHARLLLKNLAKLHALPIALRLLRPQEFDEYIRPYTQRFNMNKQMDAETLESFNGSLIKDLQQVTDNNESIVQRFKELKAGYDAFLEQPVGADTPYTSIAHCDLWINNIMLQYAADGTTPEKVKFVDFQLTQLGSVAHDVIFFLLSSVATPVLEEKFTELLHFYYDIFIECIRSVGVTVGAEYKFETFMEEIKRIAPIEVPHALFMTKVILASDSAMPEDFKDMDVNVLTKSIAGSAMAERMRDIIRISKIQEFF